MEQLGKRRKGIPEEYRRNRVILLGNMELGADLGQEETNECFRGELLRAVRYAVRSELTQRQQTCFTLFYEEGLTVRQIAREIGLCDSTVSRHITAARDKVRRYASYCAIGRAPGGREGEKHFLRGG